MRKIKAWAIVGNGNNLLANWGIGYAVFTSRQKAKMFLHTAENVTAPKVVPCTIIIHPTK